VGKVEGMIRPGGYLFVSHSESINGLGSGLRMIQPSVYRAGTGDD
jgi:chemotaxis protein methyltransferase CheR